MKTRKTIKIMDIANDFYRNQFLELDFILSEDFVMEHLGDMTDEQIEHEQYLAKLKWCRLQNSVKCTVLRIGA